MLFVVAVEKGGRGRDSLGMGWTLWCGRLTLFGMRTQRRGVGDQVEKERER